MKLRYPMDATAMTETIQDLVKHDAAQRQVITGLVAILEQYVHDDDKDSDFAAQARAILQNIKSHSIALENDVFNLKVSKIADPKKYHEEPTWDVQTLFGIDGTTEFRIDGITEEDEHSVGEGDMTAKDVAAYFKEGPAAQRAVKAKLTKTQVKSLEDIEKWEKAEDNKNDIYRIAARVKNAARVGNSAVLTQHGEILCNMFVHVAKAIYDFADEEVRDKSLRMALYDVMLANEDFPAKVIKATGVMGKPAAK